MPRKTLTHPERDVLSAFGLGKLQADQAREVETHISECEACCKTLLNLQSDTFVELVRSSNTEKRQLDEEGARLGDTSSQEHSSSQKQSGSADLSEIPTELVNHPRYRTGELIGQGGMGAVYKAEHLLMNRTVALKVINKELLTKPTVIERFRREAQAAAQLSHPNIVTAYDAEQAGDAHFLVLEYVDGTDLAAFVKQRGPLSVEVACEFIHQAAAGLQHAHECGMVHRDIKPHNLMVTTDHQVKILDFGLTTLSVDASRESRKKFIAEANQADDLPSADPELTPLENRLTNIGCTMGTPDFISPEQANNAHSADTRSDIYSLGCTLYFLLTGTPPFPGGSAAEKLDAHSRQEPQPIDLVRNDVPEQLSIIVNRMMAKNPAVRFQTSAEVATAVEPFATRLTLSASDSAGNQNDISKRGSHRFVRWGLAITATAATLVLAAVFASPEVSPPAKSKQAEQSGSGVGQSHESSPTKITKSKINESKEYPGVFYSPSAPNTPNVFRSVFQLEVVIKRGENEAQVEYADGVVVSSSGLIATVLDEPGTNQSEMGGVDSVDVLMLDGSSVATELVSYSPAYGVAILRVKDLNLRPLALSQKSLVANQRATWHAVYKDGRKTFLYTRPLQIHKSTHTVGETTDLCQIIDNGTSALSAERSGSALVSHDGSLVALMGRQKHWKVTPKNSPPRKKFAWAVPAHVIATLIEE